MKITTNVLARPNAGVAAFLCPQPEVRTMAPVRALRAGEKSVHGTAIVTDNFQGSRGWSPPI